MARYADIGRLTDGAGKVWFMTAEYDSLNDAMAANDELAEAEIRYRLLAEAFNELPQMRSQLNAQLERAKAEIVRLRATRTEAPKSSMGDGNVIAFDADRFRKSS